MKVAYLTVVFGVCLSGCTRPWESLKKEAHSLQTAYNAIFLFYVENERYPDDLGTWLEQNFHEEFHVLTSKDPSTSYHPPPIYMRLERGGKILLCFESKWYLLDQNKLKTVRKRFHRTEDINPEFRIKFDD